MTERQGIEIDYCPECRGVWLDKGELDKLIDKSSDQPAAHSQPDNYAQTVRPSEPHTVVRHGDDYQYKKRKKEGFLGDLFDF